MAELYVPLDVNAPDDPKILAAGDDAELVFYRSLCLAKRLQSDGFVSEGQAQRLLGCSPDIADRLCEVGLWATAEGGYLIVSFLKRNPSRLELAEQRRKERERKAAWRSGHAIDATELSHGTTASRPTGTERRATRSEVKRSEVKRDTREFGAEFDAWWADYPRKVGRAAALDQFTKRRKAGVALETLTAARDAYRQQLNGTDSQFVLHASTFLGPKGRWADDWTQPTAEPDAWMNR